MDKDSKVQEKSAILGAAKIVFDLFGKLIA